MIYLKKYFYLLLFILGAVCLTSCKAEDTGGKKIKDLEFTVVEDADIPEELAKIIKEKRTEPFKLSFSNKESLYVVVGYGQQRTGGYSIAVDDFYLTENAIHIRTNLIGPKKETKVKATPTYPYVVVKTGFLDKSIVYE